MKKFKSFVFSETTKKQIDLMPTAEMKLKFYEAVTNYGMFGIEPENLNDIEMIIWLPMKDLIDNCGTSKGGAPNGNSNAQKKNSNNIEENDKTSGQAYFNENNTDYEKQPETTENNRNNPKTTKTTCFEEKQPKQPENNQTTLNNHNLNHNDNLNGNGNENENHNLNSGGTFFNTLSPSQAEYSKKYLRFLKTQGFHAQKKMKSHFYKLISRTPFLQYTGRKSSRTCTATT